MLKLKAVGLVVGIGVLGLAWRWWSEAAPVAVVPPSLVSGHTEASPVSQLLDGVDRQPRSSPDSVAAESAVFGDLEEHDDWASLEIIVQENAGDSVNVELWHRGSDPGFDMPRRELAYLTDREGRLTVRVSPGEVRISAYVGDRVAVPVELEARRGESRMVYLVLGAGLAVEGHVVDAYSGSPIEGVRVEVSLQRERKDVFTDSSGWYRVFLPRDSTGYQIAFQSSGYAPDKATIGTSDDGKWVHDLPGPIDVGYRVQHPSGYGIASLDFELVPESSLRGEVLNSTLAPAAGASVAAVGYSWFGHGTCMPHSVASTVVADGSFSLSGIRSDTSYFLSIDYEGCATEQLIAPPTGNRVGVIDTITLRRSRTWNGQVVDARGGGVEGALIKLKRRSPEAAASQEPGSRDCLVLGFSPLEAVTTKDGRFMFESAPPSSFDMSVFLDGRRVHSQVLDMTGTEYLDGPIRLKKAFFSIRARVVREGQAVTDATVKLQWEGKLLTGRSDDTGSFVFRGLNDDTAWYQVQADIEGPHGTESTQSEAVRPGAPPVILSFDPQ